MKKKSLLYFAAALAIGLGACQNDDGVDMDRPIALNFSTDGVVTRATIAETGETFEAGDRVGVYLSTGNTEAVSAIGTGAAVDNEPFAKQSGGAWSGTLYWQNISQWHTFHAYYPYDAALNSSTATAKAVAVVADQHKDSGAGYKAADYLWGVSAPTRATNNSLTVQLEHRMARIVIHLSPGADMTDAEVDELAPTLEIVGGTIPATGSMDVTDGTIAASAGQDAQKLTTITPYRTGDDGEYTYFAILLPGSSFGHGDTFVRLVAPDNTTYYAYTLNTTSDLTLESGRQYIFTLTANKAGINLDQFSIKGWQTGETATGGANMVVR